MRKLGWIPSICMGVVFWGSSALGYVPSVTPTGLPMRWQTPVKLNLAGNPINLSGLSPKDFYDSVVRGLQRWKYGSSEQADFDYWQGTDPKLYSTQGQLDGISTVSFTSQSTSAPKLSSHVLGLTQVWYKPDTGEIIEADIALNDEDYVFTADPQDTSGFGGLARKSSGGKNRVYIQNVLTHEIGHAFGLSHSGSLQATMLFTESPEQAHLSCDDQIGIQALYPSTATATRGALSGTVQDENGTAVFGAHVVAVSENRGTAVASGITGADGKFSVEALEPGRYFLYAEPFYAGASALPTFYAKTDFKICENHTAFSRSFLADPQGRLLGAEVKRGLITQAGLISVHCANAGGAVVRLESSPEPARTTDPTVLFEGKGVNQGSFGKVERFDHIPDFQLYRLNSVGGQLEVHALAYSLYSPIHVSIALLSIDGAPVTADVQDPVYLGDSGFIDHDSAVIARNLPQGDYWLKVSADRLSSRFYPAPNSLDKVPFFILTGRWNEAQPSPAFPKNARCTMEENYPPYQSPPGNPRKNSDDTPTHTGFCGGISTPSDKNNPGGPSSPSGGAILGWFLPWLLIFGGRKVLPLAQNKVASYAQ